MPHKKMHKRIEDAWKDRTVSQIVSESFYDFDLDENLIHIHDYDYIFVSPHETNGLKLSVGDHVYKRIRKTAINTIAAIFKLEPSYSTKNAIGGQLISQVSANNSSNENSKSQANNSKPRATVDHKSLTLGIQNDKDLTKILINIGEEHTFRKGEIHRLDLRYQVPLNKSGEFLLFTGAIQPSDYDVARYQLKVEKAQKSVTLNVRSKNRFVGYIFNPDEMNYFPSPNVAIWKREHSCYSIIDDLPTVMKDYGRAHYFTIAADFKNIERRET